MDGKFSAILWRLPGERMTAEVLQHLSQVDVRLGTLIALVGPCELKPDSRRTPFQALIRAVAHQQLNGKAANMILSRFIALFPGSKFPSPEAVYDVDMGKLTGIGFSRAKASYVKEIARARLDGLLPGRKELKQMGDEEIVERLTQIKGIGRWSVEMFLIFSLGRPDVFPVHDFGVQQGFAIVYNKRKLPKPDQLLKHGEQWRPYRTTAAWYFWRAADLKKSKKLAV